MFATFQRPTLVQSVAGSSIFLSALKSLFTVSSIVVSTAVGFLSMGTIAALPSQAQDLETMVGYSTQLADPISADHIYTAQDIVQAMSNSAQNGAWIDPNLRLYLTLQGTSNSGPDVGIDVGIDAGTDAGAGASTGGGRLDPIDSPHPLPWSWILDIQSRPIELSTSQLFYYRSPALMSPDGVHSAYTRMQVLRVTDPQHSQVSSLLFLENTETGALQFLTATSPEMQHILLQGADSQQPGMLSMLMPISWSEEGDRVLVRAFESIFSTDIAADYAIIWHQSSNQVEQIVPTNGQYSYAVLLGWSQTHPDEVLFQVGNLGDELRSLMAMTEAGRYHMVAADEPIIYGQTTATFWNGPQASTIE